MVLVRIFGGQWWCSAWSWVRIFDGGQWWCSAWSWVRILTFWGQWQRIVLSGPNRCRYIENQRRLSFALHTNHTQISCRCWSSFYVRLTYHLSVWAIRIFHTDTWYVLRVLKVSIEILFWPTQFTFTVCLELRPGQSWQYFHKARSSRSLGPVLLLS
jgi:hypothetical protein